MRITQLLFSLVLGALTLGFSGCAVVSNGTKQAVVIRSTPEGATIKINGQAIGVTPVKVSLARQDVYLLEVQKPGFSPLQELILPSSEEYEKRFLRWGVDYDLGAAKSLIPGEINFVLKAPTAEMGVEDKYLQLVSQINRADAMLRTGELDVATHRYLVAEIVKSYQ